ncbi:hypothetical protein B0H14DRAFT_3579221 [Mycena olivaceomarginata]|nr:hypothetical protein B0H14DRAFT_3579221 [Mycena olivaceomarginata]
MYSFEFYFHCRLPVLHTNQPQVDRFFHALVSCRQLWIAVVRHLGSLGLVDPPPDEVLLTLSQPALTDEIKRVVIGPRIWSCTSRDPPTIARQYSKVESGPTQTGRIPKLVPGGKHIFLASGETIRVLEVHSALPVWSWERAGYLVNTLTLCEVNLSIVARDSLDLELGKSCETGHFSAGSVMVESCAGYGNIFAYRTAGTTLFAGYLLDGGRGDRLRLRSLASFGGLWRPFTEFSYDSPTEAKGIASAILNISIARDWERLSVTVEGSPLGDESFTLVISEVVHPPLFRRAAAWIRARRSSPANVPAPLVISRYHLVLLPEPCISLVSRFKYPMPALISAAGYCICADTEQRTVVFHPSPRKKVYHPLTVDAAGLQATGLALSGAVTHLYDSRMTVTYSNFRLFLLGFDAIAGTLKQAQGIKYAYGKSPTLLA